jgi:hypothetical protein
MGLAAGAAVELEVQDGGEFADVVLRSGTTTAAIEVFAATAGQVWEDRITAGDAVSWRLDQLGASYRVHFRGAVPPEALDLDEDWWNRLERLSKRVARTGRPQTARTLHPTGTALRVGTGPPPVGSTLSLPTVEVDQGRRLLARLRRKAEQTARGGPAVLWVEDYGLLGPLTPFDSLPLAAQVHEFADFVEGVTDQHQHVAAVVLSAGGRRTRPPREEETVTGQHGHGLIRNVGWDRRRRTLIVPGPAATPATTSLLVDLVSNERALLDRCLHNLTGAAHLIDLFTGDLIGP